MSEVRLTYNQMAEAVEYLDEVILDNSAIGGWTSQMIIEAVLEAIPSADELCRHVDNSPFKYEDEE